MDEISNKTDNLKKTLNKFITDDNLSPFINSPVKYRYRNNILFTIGYNINGKIEVGPLQKNKSVINSSENINASQLHIDICEIFKDYIINHSKLKVYKYKKESGFWKHIHIKQNSKHDFIINLRVSNFNQNKKLFEEEKDNLIEFIKNKSLQKNYNFIKLTYQECIGTKEPTINDPFHTIYYKDELIEEMLGRKFIITESTFFQVNFYTANILFSYVRDFVKENNFHRTYNSDSLLTNIKSNKRVRTNRLLLDICCGVGIYCNLLHDQFDIVIGIDNNPNNIIIAEKNSLNNNISNSIYLCSNIEDVIEKILKKYDDYEVCIIVNPPRRGLYDPVLESINTNLNKINQLIYISCFANSLNRDLTKLNLKDKNIKKIIPLNQFPNTQHYEIIINII